MKSAIKWILIIVIGLTSGKLLAKCGIHVNTIIWWIIMIPFTFIIVPLIRKITE